MRDEIVVADQQGCNRKSAVNECLVLNIDHSNNNGTHWTCLFIKNDSCYYFDSYGFQPCLEVEKYCRNVKNRYYNTFPIQTLRVWSSTQTQSDRTQNFSLKNQLNKVGCGHYCIYVLYKLHNGFTDSSNLVFDTDSQSLVCDDFYSILDELYRFQESGL